jgi:hypothetical protein
MGCRDQMDILNCWEVKKCERQQGGEKAKKLGVCPASVSIGHNGINRERYGGRFCRAITGTLCGGKVQGTFARS